MKLNKYYEQLQGLVTDVKDARAARDQSVEAIQKDGMYSQEYKNDLIKAATIELEGIEAQKLQDMKNVKKEFEADFSNWQQLQGSNFIDEDIKLLSGNFKLTAAEVKELSARHSDNYTMLRAIKEYAEAAGIQSNYIDLDGAAEVFNYFYKLYTAVITDPKSYYANLGINSEAMQRVLVDRFNTYF